MDAHTDTSSQFDDAESKLEEDLDNRKWNMKRNKKQPNDLNKFY